MLVWHATALCGGSCHSPRRATYCTSTAENRSVVWGEIERLLPEDKQKQVENFSLIARPESLCIHLSYSSVFHSRRNQFFTLLGEQ